MSGTLTQLLCSMSHVLRGAALRSSPRTSAHSRAAAGAGPVQRTLRAFASYMHGRSASRAVALTCPCSACVTVKGDLARSAAAAAPGPFKLKCVNV
jgi:hypothetical protein